MEYNQSFATRLAVTRARRGMSAPQFADMLGVSAATIRNWESGASFPPSRRLKQVADILGCSVRWLLGGPAGEEDKLAEQREPYIGASSATGITDKELGNCVSHCARLMGVEARLQAVAWIIRDQSIGALARTVSVEALASDTDGGNVGAQVQKIVRKSASPPPPAPADPPTGSARPRPAKKPKGPAKPRRNPPTNVS